MRLTPEVLRNLYSTLYCVYPFTKWKLPLPEEIDFQIDKHDKTTMGTYMYDTGDEYAHTITVSAALCGHMMTVIRVLCHECIHMSFHRQKGDKWAHHSKQFRTRCSMVALELGLDPLEL